MSNVKVVLLIIGFIFSIFIFTGVISAASLNVSEVKHASSGVKNYTEVKSDIPGYVVVSGKNSTAPSFLKSITTWTIQINNGAATPVTISSVGNPTGPSGSATGTLSKSEYLTVATNVKNFISSNGRAPNYASSSLGNIRYESLVYAYSKILVYYKTYDKLPSSISITNIVGVSGGVVIPPIDYTPPTVTANPVGGTYTTVKTVTLTATDNKDPNPAIYYTTDGTTPTISSTRYKNPLNINVSTVLKFMARDASGNQAAVQTMNYIINRVTDITTGRMYSTIQSAVNDASTLNGDIIQVSSGTYKENVVINKKLTLMAAINANVILQSPNTYGTIITINSLGNGTKIQGFTINGSTSTHGIFLYNVSDCVITGNIINNNVTNNNANGIETNGATHCTISGNNINNNGNGIGLTNNSNHNTIENNFLTYNNFDGIDLNNSNYNIVQNNTASHNKFNGIHINYSNYNTVYNNTTTYQNNEYDSTGIYVYNGSNNSLKNNILTYNGFGLYLGYNSNNIVRKNTITNNGYGIYIMNVSANINYNNIYNNSKIGLCNYNEGAIVDATYNWWGHTTTPTQGSANGNDYYNDSINFNVNPWLVLNANSYIILNENTQRLFTNIQQAINDTATNPGDTIIIDNGTYNENIIINKKINLIAGNGTSPSLTGTITINSGGNGTLIQNLTINGTINLNANNCTIYENIITGNGAPGIKISNSTDNIITYNKIISAGYDGIQSISSSNKIIRNNISGCITGIYSENSNNTIKNNNIVNNNNGIWTHNSTDTIQFNRITGNNYGLKNEIGTVNATNNWWGSNTPIVSSSNPSDIYNNSGTVNYNPYLILIVNVSSTNSGGNTSVTADLTHNNQGSDTSSQGFIPNGTPVNFTTNNGTIVNTAYTIKGQAATILNLNSLQPQNVTVSASLDNQNVSATGIVSTESAVLNITSTAIDNLTGQTLNTTYTIPLNNSITWLSIVWINTDMFTDELQIIVDGIVVQDKYFNNTAYITWQNTYSTSVFNAIKYVNYHLPFIDSSELTTFWNNLTSTYNLTSAELEFIQIHREDFIDDLTFNIVYPGVSGFNLTVTDPNSNVINLNFPRNVVQRTSKVIYTGSRGEGVKSFAIATANVTDDVLQYWWNQYSSYQTGSAMNVAYNTFLTALMIEYAHDRIADNMKTPLNVTWSRTSPVIVSVGEDPYQIYETLESDHVMGMTVIGTIENMWIFNFETSSSIPFIENEIMSNAYNSTFSSVTIEINYLFNNYKMYVETFEYDGFVIVKSIFNSFIVIDLETGIVRDIDTVNRLYGGLYELGGRTTEFGKLYFFKKTGKMIGYKTLIGFKLFTWQTSNPWDLGTASFNWDGLGSVFISGNGMYLVDIMADNILSITGPKGSKTVEGTQEALDITDILDEKNPSLQTLNFVLEDTDGGFIATSPLYIVQTSLDRQDMDLPPLFPCPAPTLPEAEDLPQNAQEENLPDSIGFRIPSYRDNNGNIVYTYIYFELRWPFNQFI